MPYFPRRSPRKHASIRRLRKRVNRAVLFLFVIIAATYALNFFFKLEQYLPDTKNQATGLDRDVLLKKLEEAGKKPRQAPAQSPPRR